MKRFSRMMLSTAMVAALAVTVGFASHPSAIVRASAIRYALPIINDSDMTLGGSSWVQTLDPATEADVNSGYFTQKFDGYLVEMNTNGQPILELAKSYKVSKNHLTYTFTLRSGLHFYGGDAITPYDVKWSLARGFMEKISLPYKEDLYYGSYIKGATQVDAGGSSETISKAMNDLSGVRYNNAANTVSITTTKPTPFFLKAFTYASFAVLDPNALDSPNAGNNTQLTNTCDAVRDNSSGPFIPVCLNSGSGTDHGSFFPLGQTPYILAAPNPRYVGVGGKPTYEIKSEVIDTAEEAYAAYKQGSEDIVGIPPEDLSTAHQVGDSKFYKTPTSGVFYLTPNFDKKPFSSFACRMVVAWGINRPALAKIFHNEEVPQYEVLPPNIAGHYNGAGAPHYNKAKAAGYLPACAKAIGSKTLSFTLPYSTGSTASDLEFAAIQAQLDSLKNGKDKVKVAIAPLQSGDYYTLIGTDLNKSSHPEWSHIAQAGWFQDFPDGFDYCTLLLRGGQNYDIGNFNNKQYNKDVDKAAVIFNQKERIKLYIAAQKIAMAQGGWIPLTNEVGYSLVRKNITGLVFSAQYAFSTAKGMNWASVHVK